MAEKFWPAPLVVVDLGGGQLFIRSVATWNAYICGKTFFDQLQSFNGNAVGELLPRDTSETELRAIETLMRGKLLLSEEGFRTLRERREDAPESLARPSGPARFWAGRRGGRSIQVLEAFTLNPYLLVEERSYGVSVCLPLGGILLLTKDLWSIAKNIAGGSQESRARLGSDGQLAAIVRFLQSNGVLIDDSENYCLTVQDHVESVIGSDWQVKPDEVVELPVLQWNVTPEPVVFDTADFEHVGTTTNILLLGACHSVLPARVLQKLSLQQGMLTEVQQLDMVERWGEVVPPIQQPDFIFYQLSTPQVSDLNAAVGLGYTQRLGRLLNEAVTRIDYGVELVRRETEAPIFVLAPSIATVFPTELYSYGQLMELYGDLENQLVTVMADKTDVQVISESRVYMATRGGLDDSWNASAHRAAVSDRSSMFPSALREQRIRDESTARGEVASFEVASALLQAIRKAAMKPLKGVVFRPDGLLWAAPRTEETFEKRVGINPWTIWNFEYSGVNEPLKMLRNHGVRLFCVCDQPEILAAQWRTARAEYLINRDDVDVVREEDLLSQLKNRDVDVDHALVVGTPRQPAIMSSDAIDGFVGELAELRQLLFELPIEQDRTTEKVEIRPQISTTTANAKDVVERTLCAHLACSVEALRSTKSLRSLGLESLDAQQVVATIETELDIQFPDSSLREGVLFSYSALVEETTRARPRLVLGANSRKDSSLFGNHTYESWIARDLQSVAREALSAGRSRPWSFKFRRSVEQGDWEYATSLGILREANRFVAALAAKEVPRGSVVSILCDQGRDLVCAHLGALLYPSVPSILAPPNVKHGVDRFLSWLAPVLKRGNVRCLIVKPELTELVRREVGRQRLDVTIISTEEIAANEIDIAATTCFPSSVALIQHSSGTTGLKKGVGLTHEQVLAQLWHLGQRLSLSAEDTVVSWLPLYHDMGFVGSYLSPLLLGIRCVMMSPIDWVGNPNLYFEEVTVEKGTLGWFPNFAFSHSARAVSRRKIDFDLSSLRLLINCSEPVSSEAHKELYDALGPFGLRYSALSCSYAMAENTFAVTQTRPGKAPKVLRLDEQALRKKHSVLPTQSEEGVTYLSCGEPVVGTEVRIVDSNESFNSDQVGEIAIKGDCVVAGYLSDAEATEEAFRDGWYHTGDLGFMFDGELYVVGRKKDLIIVAGHNLYPHEVEAWVASSVPEIHPGRAVAVGMRRAQEGTERLAVLAELTDSAVSDAKLLRLKKQIRDEVSAVFQVVPSVVELFDKGTLLKSTSGKLSRRANCEAYLKESITPLGTPAPA